MNFTYNGIITRSLKNQKEFVYINKIPLCILNEKELQYYQFIVEFQKQYYSRPTFEVFQNHYTYFRPDSIDENIPLEYVVDEFINDRRTDYIKRQMLEADKKGIDIYAPSFIEDLIKKSAPRNIDILDYNTYDRNEHFNAVQKIDFGLGWFDETFGGLHSTDYGIIFGSLGNGKTTLLLYLIHHLAKYKNQNILVYSNEMTKTEFVQKLDAFSTGINPKLFRTQKWSDDNSEKEKLLKLNEELRDAKNRITVVGTIRGPSQILHTMDTLDHEVDLVCIDGLHLMGGSSANQSEKTISLGEVSREIRLMTLEHNFPVLAVTQGNREAAKTDEPSPEQIGLAYSIMQDASFAISSSVVEVNGQTMFKYYSSKNRFDTRSSIYAHFDWENLNVSWKNIKDIAPSDF